MDMCVWVLVSQAVGAFWDFWVGVGNMAEQGEKVAAGRGDIT